MVVEITYEQFMRDSTLEWFDAVQQPMPMLAA